MSVFAYFRESRRKTPVAVCLKENERLFGDSAIGVVSPFKTVLKLSLIPELKFILNFIVCPFSL